MSQSKAIVHRMRLHCASTIVKVLLHRPQYSRISKNVFRRKFEYGDAPKHAVCLITNSTSPESISPPYILSNECFLYLVRIVSFVVYASPNKRLLSEKSAPLARDHGFSPRAMKGLRELRHVLQQRVTRRVVDGVVAADALCVANGDKRNDGLEICVL